MISFVVSGMDNYEVLRPIGKGKFAVVYRAKRKADGELGEYDESGLIRRQWRCCRFMTYPYPPFTLLLVNAVALKKISIDMMDEKAREKCLKEVGVHPR